MKEGRVRPRGSALFGKVQKAFEEEGEADCEIRSGYGVTRSILGAYLSEKVFFVGCIVYCSAYVMM